MDIEKSIIKTIEYVPLFVRIFPAIVATKEEGMELVKTIL